MKFLKNLFRKLFGLHIPEGNYVATVIDVSVKRLKPKRLSLIKIKLNLTNIETGVTVTHVETLVDDFDTICLSDFAWLFEIYRIYCVDFYDLIGAVFDITVEHNVVCGRKNVAFWYNGVIVPPCVFDESEVD